MIASFEFMVFLLGVVLLAVGCAIQWGWPIGVAIVGAALIGEMKLGD